MRFELIMPEALHSVWPYVKVGLERVREVTPERWLAEDIFAHIRIGRAQLYLGYDGTQCRGFFITENKRELFSNVPYLNVWVLWAEPTIGEHCAQVDGFIAETIAFIDACAKKVGAQWISWEGRWGWAKYLKDYFKPIKVRYEREVSYV